MKQSLLQPLASFDSTEIYSGLIKGEGAFLYDINHKEYIDLISGLWNVPFGYSNSEIKDRIKEQLQELPFINFIHEHSPEQEKLARKLLRFMPSQMSRVFLTCSGSEANEYAIKVARKYQNLKNKRNKKKIGVFDLSYHGTTYAAMSASGMDKVEINEYAPTVPGFIKLKTPMSKAYWEGRTEEVYQQDILDNLESVLNKEKNDLAAVLIEPIIASGGMFQFPKWYLDKLSQICIANDILIIVDEVATGFGRTGNIFASDIMSLDPDIICLSKAITNGYVPLGAVVLGRKIDIKFSESKQFIEHFSTQNGNLLSVSAALAVLELIDNNDFAEKIQSLTKVFHNALVEHLQGIDSVREVRDFGLMAGIDLIDRYGRPLTVDKLLSTVQELRKKGILVYEFYLKDLVSGISLFPPYIIKPEILYKSVKKIGKVLLQNRY